MPYMKKNNEEIVEDLLRLDYNDKGLTKVLEKSRREYKEKGLPYFEPWASKFTGGVKYLLKEENDGSGKILITDLDTNDTYVFK